METPVLCEEQLIEKVKQNPSLWDNNDPQYYNRTFEKELWIEISEFLEVDVDTCKKRWQNLRNQYRRERVRNKPTKWKHYDRLRFLAEIFDSKAEERRIPHAAKDDDLTGNERNSTFEEDYSSFENGAVPPSGHQDETSTVTPRPANHFAVSNSSNFYFVVSLAELLDALPPQNQLAVRKGLLEKIEEFQSYQQDEPRTVTPTPANHFAVSHSSNFYFVVSLAELLDALPPQNQLAVRKGLLEKIEEFQ